MKVIKFLCGFVTFSTTLSSIVPSNAAAVSQPSHNRLKKPEHTLVNTHNTHVHTHLYKHFHTLPHPHTVSLYLYLFISIRFFYVKIIKKTNISTLSAKRSRKSEVCFYRFSSRRRALQHVAFQGGSLKFWIEEGGKVCNYSGLLLFIYFFVPIAKTHFCKLKLLIDNKK